MVNLLLIPFGNLLLSLPPQRIQSALPGVIFLPFLQIVVHHRVRRRLGECVQHRLTVRDGLPRQAGNGGIRLHVPVRRFQLFHNSLDEILDLSSQAPVLLFDLLGDPGNGVRVRQHRLHHFRHGLAVGNGPQLFFAPALVFLRVPQYGLLRLDQPVHIHVGFPQHVEQNIRELPELLRAQLFHKMGELVAQGSVCYSLEIRIYFTINM